jgi:hypothetical protein
MKHPRDWTLEHWRTCWLTVAIIARGLALGLIGPAVVSLALWQPIKAVIFAVIGSWMFMFMKLARRNERRSIEWIKIRDDVMRTRRS